MYQVQTLKLFKQKYKKNKNVLLYLLGICLEKLSQKTKI